MKLYMVYFISGLFLNAYKILASVGGGVVKSRVLISMFRGNVKYIQFIPNSRSLTLAITKWLQAVNQVKFLEELLDHETQHPGRVAGEGVLEQEEATGSWSNSPVFLVLIWGQSKGPGQRTPDSV